MSKEYFNKRVKEVIDNHNAVISRKNEKKFRKYAPQFFSERGIDV